MQVDTYLKNNNYGGFMMKKFLKSTAFLLVLAFCLQLVPANMKFFFAEEPEPAATAQQVQDEVVEAEDSEAYILSEITDERDAYTKRFRMSDGTIQAAQYTEPVHFDQDGQWVDYDNTVNEIEDEGQAALRNKESDLGIVLSKKSNGSKLVRLEKDGYKLSWQFRDIAKRDAEVTTYEEDGDLSTLEKSVSEIWYRNAFDSVDLQYLLSSGYLKENIILNNAQVQTVFEAEYKCPQLTPELIDGKTVHLKDGDGNIIFVISAPYMQDRTGASCSNISYELVDVKNGKFTLRMVLDHEWLAQEDRQFPVTVDPVFMTSQAWNHQTTCMVSYVASGRPDTKYGYTVPDNPNYEGSVYVGYDSYQNMGKLRTYLKVTQLPTLKNGDKVVDARVNFGLHNTDGDLQINLYQVTGSWDNSNLTWNNQPAADFGTVHDYKLLRSYHSAQWVTWEITTLVQQWYDGSCANNGIVLTRDVEDTAVGRAWFYGKIPGFPTNRPCLSISYRNMFGYEDYYTYTNVAAGRNGVASINNYNGQLVYSQSLTEDCGGNIMPVNISLVYNSNKGGMGYSNIGRGVQTNYHLFIAENSYLNATSTDEEKKYKYLFNDADGTEHYFYFENLTDTTAKDEDGLGYTLTVDESVAKNTMGTTRYTIKDKNGNKMLFDGYGHITRIEDKNGNAIKVEYESSPHGNPPRMVRIKDGVDRTYTITYHSDADIIDTIKDPAGRTTTIEYAYDNLWGIVFPDGKRVGFYTTSDGLWSRIYGNMLPTYVELEYETTEQKRVKRIEEKTDTASVGKYTFQYVSNTTWVTDNQDRTFEYQFNDYAQTTGVVSKVNGQAQFFQYNPSDRTELTNKMISSSKIQTSHINYVVNPTFDSNTLSDAYYTWFEDSLEDTSPIVLDESISNLTPKSVKVSKSSAPGAKYLLQEVRDKPAGWYTFSAYVKTDGTISNNGAVVSIEVWGDSGPETIYAAEGITQTDGWERYVTSAYLPENKFIKIIVGLRDNAAGTVWFDDLQFESGQGATGFNLLENACFSNQLYRWQLEGVDYGWTTVNNNDVPNIGTALYLHSDANSPLTRAEQFIVVSDGKKGDVYSVGGWSKGNSVPTKDRVDLYRYGLPEYYMSISFMNENNEYVGEMQRKDFNPDYDGWQFNTFEAVAEGDYKYIFVAISQCYNPNQFQATGLFCCREQYGQSYTYDKDGNVVSSVDLAKTQSEFAYQGNQMTKLLNPSGSSYLYSYSGWEDGSQKNLDHANSTDGQQYSFTYDDKGNVTSSVISQSKVVSQLQPDTTYIIRNAYSSNAMDSGDQSGFNENRTKNFRYIQNALYQKWQLESTGEADVYKIKSPHFNMYLQANADNYLKIENASSSNAQKFKIVPNGDGTFRILTGASGYTKCIDGQPEEEINTQDQSPIQQCDYVDGDYGQKWYFFQKIDPSDKIIETSAAYTADKNFPVIVTDAAGNDSYTFYNPTTGQLSNTIDGELNRTSYKYEANSNRISTVSAGESSVQYVYDWATRLDTIKQNGDEKYKFTYDSLGRVSQISVSNGNGFTPLMTTTYDAYSRPTVKTYGNDDMFTTYYDALDNVTEIKYNNNDQKRICYYYATDNTLSHMVDYFEGTTTWYTYDLAGRVVAIRTYDTTATSYSGQQLSNEIKYTYADKTNYLTGVRHYTPELGVQELTYRYGNLANGEMPDQIYGISYNGVEKLTFSYDGLGRVTEKEITTTSSKKLTETYTYQDIPNSNKTTTQVQSLTNPVGSYTYTYDANGNIASENVTINYMKPRSRSISYEYDELNRLKRVNNASRHYTLVFEYDARGNILAQKYYDYTEGELGQLKSTDTYTYTAGWNDLLTSFRGESITYDEIGNPVQYLGDTLTWTEGRRLASLSRPYPGQPENQTIYTYEYNAAGQRTSKTKTYSYSGESITTEFIYEGDLLVGQKTSDGKGDMTFLHDDTGAYIGLIYEGVEYYYMKNVQGDIIGIVDAEGVIQAVYTYEPFGKLFSIETKSGFLRYDGDWSVGGMNPIRYRGYYYDYDTKLYYLNSRYYDPYVGRFLNADGYVSTGQGVTGFNMFAYCLDNPVNMTDETGGFPFFAITAAIGAVVGAVVGGVVAAKNGGNIWAGIGIGAAAGALIGTGVGMAAGAALAGSITATTGAVMAGGSALVSTVATGGFGAGATYVANNLQQAASNLAPAAQAAANKMQQVVAKGKAGETASGLVKNTQRIYITAIKYRIPDGLDTTNKILSEVKNYSGKLSFTSQLRDFVSWSQSNGYQMHLYTNAHLTGPLQRAVDSELIQVFPLK